MRREVWYAIVPVMMLGLVSTASATGWGVGGFVGASIPVVQDDGEKGFLAGGQLRLSMGMIGLEPNFTFFRNGDYAVDKVDGTFRGSKFAAVGLNLLLAGGGPPTGMRFFPFVGFKYYNENNDERDFSEGKVGWNAGLGLEVGAGTIGIEARASGELMTLKDGGSRKWVHLRGGLNYYFGAL